MKDQLQTIREAVNELHNSFPEKERALTALAQLEAMVGEQEPVACAKCHGTGYYDEGHECDDGTMAGGNYVLCDKCAAPVAQQPQAEPDWINGVPHWSPALIAKVKQMSAELDEPEQPQAEAVPPTHVLVPVEPTDEMFIGGMEADLLGRPSPDDDSHVRGIWNAMLAAAKKEAGHE